VKGGEKWSEGPGMDWFGLESFGKGKIDDCEEKGESLGLWA